MTLLYTILPHDIVLAGIENHNPDYKELTMNGMTVIVEMTNMNEARIVRLISPNPNDYLNPKYAPGQMIAFSPQFN